MTILLTSRRVLRISGEHVYPVPPMSLDRELDAEANGAPGHPHGVASEAVRLFMERASAASPGIAWDDDNEEIVAAICERLDGLPLAIELAASRSSQFGPPAMLMQLDHRLPILGIGPRDQPARLQTLRNAIAWSYDLLTGAEQALFRRLSVFVDGFTLAAAAAVGDQADEHAAARLQALIDQSLVRAVAETTGTPRYTMLETIREFGLDQLAAAGDLDHVQARHARYFLSLAERIDPEVDGPEADTWLARLDTDRANLRAALGWMIAQDRSEDALRLAAALWRYWRIRGYLSEGRESLASALALPGPAPPSTRGDALWKLGFLHLFMNEHDEARANLEQSVALMAAAGDRAGEATAVDSLGTVWLLKQDFPRARACHERALAIRRKLGNRFDAGITLSNLGKVALFRGDLVEARPLLEEALEIARESGSERELAHRCMNLGQLEFAEGNLAATWELAERALAIFEDVGDHVAVTAAQEMLGRVASESRDHGNALRLLAESLRLRLKLGLLNNLIELVETLASALLVRDPVLAARLMAAATANREATGIARMPWEESPWTRSLVAAQAALGATRFASAWRAGQALTLLAAAHEAEAALPTLVESEPDAAVALDHSTLPLEDPGLTPRELDVLRLAALHLSNREIAGELYLSPATVKRHMSNILGKMQVPSRTAAIDRAREQGLIPPFSKQ